jgi:hypothetical protein
MKKALILTLAALMLLGTAAFATQTRVLTLGEANNYVLDEANIWLYPSRISMYPNVAIGEIGNYYDESSDYDVSQFGVHWKFGEKNPWTLGTYFYQSGWQSPNGDQLGISNTVLPFYYPMPSLTDWVSSDYQYSNKRVTLFGGREMGGNYFGFSLNAVQSSFKDESAANVYGKHGVSEYDLALGLTDKNGKWDIAAGINMFSFSNMYDATHYVYKPKGNNTMWVMGRLFKQINPQWTIVPNAGIILSKYEAEHYTEATVQTVDYTQKWNTFTFWGGLGAHYTPSANVLAVGEFGIAVNTYKSTFTDNVAAAPNFSYEYKYTYFTLPYLKMGVEGKVFDWMDVRFGAVSYWHRESDEGTPADATVYTPYKYKYNYPDNYTYFGTGLHFGSFHIDTYTDPQIFLKGFNFISGGQTVDLNWHVSVLYDFK